MTLRLIIGGRLGNQLFQYAAVRAQAKRLEVDLEIDLQFCSSETADKSFSFWLDSLPIRARVIRYPVSGPLSAHGPFRRVYRRALQPALWRRYDQPLWQTDSRFFDIKPRTIVSGYFQSLFYLLPRDEDVLAELNLWNAAPSSAAVRARMMAQQSSVSVHVRRGDAVSPKGESETLPVWQPRHPAYLEAAMNLIRSKLNNPTFFIFSDEIEWCKASGIFGDDCEFVQSNEFGDNPAIDLLLMSNCRHHIITNSTYSWWAAWAAFDDEKLCILPQKWTPTQTTAELNLVYGNWITL